MRKHTTQTTRQKIASATAPSMHTIGGELNAMATHHIGYVDCDGSQTPVGINMNGVTFEDANYALADNDHPRFLKWERQVLEALRRGEPRGKAAGLDWTFIGEADTDTSVLYPTTSASQSWPCDKSNPFTDDAIYEDLTSVATEFADSLCGDSGYEKPEINFVALVERLVGYILSQKWAADYETYARVNHPREDIAVLASDLATQLATDAVQTTNPRFALA